jgi:hypothetical protein
MNYQKTLEAHRRLGRTEDALERRREALHDQFEPLLRAWLGKAAIGAGLRKVNMFAKHVELLYCYYHRGEESGDYSVMLSREVCESPNAIAEVEALRKLELHKAEEQRKADRIAELQRELGRLGA